MKTIKLILTGILLLVNISAFCQRQQIGTSNTYWELIITGNDTTLKITGTGEMPDFVYNSDVPWSGIRSTFKSLELGDSITKIGQYCFYHCSGFTGMLNLPNGLTSIGGSAFINCSGLTVLNLPNSLVFIDDYAFYGCSGLTTLDLHDNISSIGQYAFCHCSGLTAVTFPSNLDSIKRNTFYGCSGLTTLNFPNSLVSIEMYAFFNCTGLTDTLHLPSNLTFLGIQAFRQCSKLTSLHLPNSLTSIGEYAFRGCRGLTSVSFPKDLDTIGNYAFMECIRLVSINLPEKLSYIGNSAFRDCLGLTSLYLPNSITSIGNRAFMDCSILSEIVNVSQTPLSIDTTVFQGVNKVTCALKIPTSSLNAYQQAPIWQDFLLEGAGFLVTVLSNNALWGTVSDIPNRLYTAGENINLQATPKTGYLFENWTGNGTVLSTDNPFYYTVKQDVTILANFNDEVSMRDMENQGTKIIIYPNPIEDKIHIQSSLFIEQINIYNISGKKVKQINNVQEFVSVNDLANGIYLIKVKTENGEAVKKIIKQ